MGLFDDLKCYAPLPGTPPAFVMANWPDHGFQTKDVRDEPYMDTFVITQGGRLLGPDGGEIALHGDVSFYSGNTLASYRDMRVTRDGADWEWVEYVARFTEGRLVRITETERERGPSVSMAELDRVHAADRASRPAVSPPDRPA